MELIKFKHSYSIDGVSYDAEAYINKNIITHVTDFKDSESDSIIYPKSSAIYFGHDHSMRVDGAIEEVIAKLNGGE